MISQTGKVRAGQGLTIEAHQLINQGAINSEQKVTLFGITLDNQGAIYGREGIQSHLNDKITNQGKMTSGGEVRIIAVKALHNIKVLRANQKVYIQSEQLINQGAIASKNDQLYI